MRSLISAAALLASSAVFAAQALAVPIMIDFTDSSWLGVQGKSTNTRTYGSLDVTLSASGSMTFNAHEAPNLDSSSLALHGDGIGVGNDEIGWGQKIDVQFSSSVTVLGYYLLDFFTGEGPGGIGEVAHVMFDTESFLDEGFATDGVGYYSRDLSLQTTSISFMAGPGEGMTLATTALSNVVDFRFSDFALAGILIDTGTAAVSVPEPETFVLFGFGIASLVLARTRRHAANRLRTRPCPAA